VREATSDDDQSQSTFEDDFVGDDAFNAWRQQFQANYNQNQNERGGAASQRTERTRSPNSISTQSDVEERPSSTQPSTTQAMESETDHLRLLEQNQRLEREVRRLNHLIELLAEELQSKIDMDEA
jgi:hypothetical protein